jgi:PST family polysaccharide transporter
MLHSLYTATGILYTVKGTTDVQFKLGAVDSFLMIIGFIIGLSYGVNGVAFSYLIVNIIMLYPIFKISWGQIELSVREGLLVILPIFIISIFMGCGIYLLHNIFLYSIENEIIRLILLVIIGAILYISMLKLKYKDLKKVFKI